MPSSQARSSTPKAAASSRCEPKIMVPRQSRLTGSPLLSSRTVSTCTSVVVEASAGLAAQLATFDLFPERSRRTVSALHLAPILQRAVEDVQPAEIEDLEGSHGPVEPFVHRGI